MKIKCCEYVLPNVAAPRLYLEHREGVAAFDGGAEGVLPAQGQQRLEVERSGHLYSGNGEA